MIERPMLAWHHYCKFACPYLGSQVKKLESSPEGATVVVPEKMCPLVATFAVEAAVENIANHEPDSYVAEPGAHAGIERDALEAKAEQTIKDYDTNVERCARKLVNEGADNVTYGEVVTVPDSEVYEIISDLSRPSD